MGRDQWMAQARGIRLERWEGLSLYLKMLGDFGESQDQIFIYKMIRMELLSLISYNEVIRKLAGFTVLLDQVMLCDAHTWGQSQVHRPCRVPRTGWPRCLAAARGRGPRSMPV